MEDDVPQWHWKKADETVPRTESKPAVTTFPAGYLVKDADSADRTRQWEYQKGEIRMEQKFKNTRELAEAFRAKLIDSYEEYNDEIVCGEIVDDPATGQVYFMIEVPGALPVKADFSRKQ